MKKRMVVKLFSIILVLCTIFIFTACNENDNVDYPTHDTALTSKVVLFIGDGMGPNHVYNTELYSGKDMYFSNFPTKTIVDTNSLSGTTDSSAAATAMATGQRIINGRVAINDKKEAMVSITELAKNDRYGTGVVTSDEITGATPAGFSAHAESRDNSASILLSQESSTLDLLLGAGSYSSVYKDRFANNGWNWVEKYSDLSLDNKRFVATFENVGYSNGTDEEPTLTELASYAIDYMEKNYPTGYFLMIEGAKIDKASHSNDVSEMINNALDFSNAIRVVDQKLFGAGDPYTIMVTADHETGGIKKAENKEQINDDLYTTTDHTDTKVGLYFKSTLTEVPSIINKESILNTDIFILTKTLLGIQ